MKLQDVLYSQGFGTRRICAGLIQQGQVELVSDLEHSSWAVCTDSLAECLLEEGLRFRVQGVEWPYREKAYIALHKPAGTECSQKPSRHPSVYTLLPACLRQRPARGVIQGVQAVGRLDQDTTGLLLLSDDGQFIHRMSSPKKHVPKVYRVSAKHTVSEQQIERLLEGVVLDDDPRPVRAAACSLVDNGCIDLTLTEGKYHQVKRMLAAVGNRVEALHRQSIGNYRLPADLGPGQWRWLSEKDLEALQDTA
jgi:16S rRNA pseudouridine516 synthase